MNPVFRYTDTALATLEDLAQQEPELWLNPETDFTALLAAKNVNPVVEPCAPKGINAIKPIAMPAVTGHRHALGDLPAFEFSDNLENLLPQHLNDINLIAWLACEHLKEFALTRWPASKGTPNWVKHHFLNDTAAERTQWNVAGRLLWLPYTARRAAAASGGAYTPQQALEHFCDHAEQYHTAVSYDVLANPLLLSEYLYALMNRPGAKHDGRGRQLARALNLRAGAVVLDALPRAEIRALLADKCQELEKANAKKTLNVLSLGAGVQSTVLALMAEAGYEGFEKPDLAIFADTGWEPQAVYDHLDWLETQLSYPVVRVRNGNIRESILRGKNPDGRQFLDVPVYVVKPDGKNYVGTRQCTKLYKIQPIYKYLKEVLINSPKGEKVKDTQVLMWMGISLDEAARQKEAKAPWVTNTYPLLDRRYSRLQLQQWFAERYPERALPKSACIGCPYHSNAAWAYMKEHDKVSWNDAVGVDWALRNLPQSAGTIEGTAYLHRSRKPLNEVDFGNAAEKHEAEMQEECEGLCGI